MTHVRQSQEWSQRDTHQELSGDEYLPVRGEELHKDDRYDTDKGTKHGPLVANPVYDPTSSRETDELARFGDLFQNRLTRGTG